ncbi:DUF2637 domain-containing protein [Streptomyces uncialis]|uniref:DUF2637 domain-containing protein n=1 Tax=Streptomyces uncialis TaxID=1048205 RepID=UPI00379DBE5B
MTAPVDIRKPVPAPAADDDPLPRRAAPGPAGHPVLDHDDDQDHDHEVQDSAPAPDGSEPRLAYAKWELWLAAFGVLLGTGVAVLGLYSSFGALYDKAEQSVAEGGWGWEHPWLLPVGTDLSILAFGIVNLLLIRARRPLWWVKWVPRGGTVLTIYLNWEAANSLPAQVGHAGLAALWVIFSEIAAHLYAAHIGEVHGARRMGKVRLSRWLCQPLTTLRIWKLMRQDEITDYAEALNHHKEWMVYEQRLAAKYGTRRWRRKAVQEELAPFQLARVGLSVDEALAVPFMEEVRETQRLADSAVQRAEAEIQKVAAGVQIQTATIQAEVDKIRAEGQLKIAKAEAEREAQAEIQRAEADAQLRESERVHALKLKEDEAAARVQDLADETEKRRTLARIERERAQSAWGMEQQQMTAQATEAERRVAADASARARRDEIARQAGLAEEQQRLAAADAAANKALAEAAEHERIAAEHRAREAEADRLAQLDREETAASLAREEKAKAEAAEHQAGIREFEARAVKAAALARMNQVDWDTQRVVAMIRARGESAVTIRVIADELGTSTGSAQDRKNRAVEILRKESGDGSVAEQSAA